MKLQSEGIISNYKVARGFMNSISDIAALIDDNQDSDTSSEYVPSESEYASDSDSDYSPEYFKSYAKKYIQHKNNNTQTDFIKNELSKKFLINSFCVCSNII